MHFGNDAMWILILIKNVQNVKVLNGADSVLAKLVWSDNLDIDDKAVLGMGIRFMAIAPEDRQYIVALVEKEKW